MSKSLANVDTDTLLAEVRRRAESSSSTGAKPGRAKRRDDKSNARLMLALCVVRKRYLIDDLAVICDALLDCGWDCIDPDGYMQKPPEEVADLLEGGVFRGRSYKDLTEGQKGLFNTICDSYVRAVRALQRALS